MFDEISPRYDFLNRMLSWGQDLHWRRRMGFYLPTKDNLQVLDVATGTADVPLELMEANPRIISVDGIDLALKMLAKEITARQTPTRGRGRNRRKKSLNTR